MDDLKQLWPQIRAKLKRDADKAEWIAAKLQECHEAFEIGDNEKGRQALWDVYNSGVKALR
jgi:hypothetical protein